MWQRDFVLPLFVQDSLCKLEVENAAEEAHKLRCTGPSTDYLKYCLSLNFEESLENSMWAGGADRGKGLGC